MSNIEKIRQEIERRKKICEGIFERESDTYYQGKAVAYGELLPFIDSLPEEEPSDDLEEAARHSEILTYPMPEDGDIEKVMKVQEARIFHEIGFIAGSEWKKEQMMKEVKFGVVCKNGERDEEDVWIELNPGSLPDYKDTDPIDFIIVKQ